MMSFVKSISLLGAVSVASLSAASAGNLNLVAQDDLFGGGLLDLDETPMSADELGAARGGFRYGGMEFNISVDIAPLQIAPLFPNGMFGDSGGPLPNGVFGDGGHGNSGSSNSGNANANNASQGSVAPPAVDPSTVAPASAASASTTIAPAASATAPAQQVPTAIVSSLSPVTTTSQTQAALPVASTAPSAAHADSGSQTLGNSPDLSQVLDNSGQASGAAGSTAGVQTPAAVTPSPVAAPSNNVADNTGGTTTAPANNNPSPSNDNTSAPTLAQTTPSGSAADGSGNTDSSESSLSMVMSELPETEVIRQSGPNGLATIVNNSRNNVYLSQNVQLNVEVRNYSFVTGLTRATNMTSQAVSQSIFLRGLN